MCRLWTLTLTATLILLAVLCSVANGQEILTETDVPAVTIAPGITSSDEPEMSTEKDPDMEICKGSAAGLKTCVNKPCPKTGLFRNNECMCRCCNGLQPFCDRTCFKESQTGIEVCIRECKCRKSTRQYLCVSHAWLVARGLQRLAIHTSTERTRVLCLRNSQLPCGTPGHLLKSCTNTNGVPSCTFKSYQEICKEQPLDCIEDMQRVSRLSHNHQWETHQYEHNNEERLHLTSLSVKTDGLYFTYKIAQLTDIFIAAGLGRFCDVVQKVILTMKSADCRTIVTPWTEIHRYSYT